MPKVFNSHVRCKLFLKYAMYLRCARERVFEKKVGGFHPLGTCRWCAASTALSDASTAMASNETAARLYRTVASTKSFLH
ncbi:hypothetical protein NPIL_276841 [Nephila pilipes]|uniref:Uncharacterized protein n=1 Tax=Nephila pilipes TaxID=299642 RepID=A0A8X6TXP4_NEPPI|nr:hypothetical protein NPIL_276841 [Nephila pilipes]